jgi:hypothetical protein
MPDNMTMNRYVLVLGMAAVLSVATSLAAQSVDLDLTTAARPIPTGEPEGTVEVTTLSGSSSSSEAAPPLLRVRLLRMPASCQLGEPLVFDVELQNISSAPLMLPWTLDPSNEGRSNAPAAFPAMNVWLRLERQGVPEAVDGGDTLFGDPSDAFTMRTVQPRERVVIRATAVCATVNYQNERHGRRGNHPFRVFAAVSLNKSSTMTGRSIHSNSLPLAIVYPEP